MPEVILENKQGQSNQQTGKKTGKTRWNGKKQEETEKLKAEKKLKSEETE